MADSKITTLTALTGDAAVNSDVIPIVDVGSPSVTKKITRQELFQYTPNILIYDVAPSLRLLESDGSAGFDGNRIYRSADAFIIQTMDGSTAVSSDYRMTSDAAGALTHEFRVGNAEKARVDGTGLGIGTAAPLTKLDVNGDAAIRGSIYAVQPAPTSKSAAATLTAAELKTHIIQYTGAAANLTLPLATNMEAGLPFAGFTNLSFEFSIINTGSGAATLTANTGFTIVGAAAVANGASGRFCVRRTSSTTYVAYRIS